MIDGAGPGFRDRVERLRAATREFGFEPVGLSALTDEASLEDSGLEHDGLAAL